MDKELAAEVVKLMEIFHKSFFNKNGEVILELRRNIYINFKVVKNIRELKLNLLEWKSRPCIKGDDDRILTRFRNRLNRYFKKYSRREFSLEEWELIYQRLGNQVNRPLSEKFLDSNFDMKVLEE